VIVPHRPHRDAGVRRQLTDRQHALILPQLAQTRSTPAQEILRW
jgi:hypothetical protein